jgi:hypothetical protein
MVRLYFGNTVYVCIFVDSPGLIVLPTISLHIANSLTPNKNSIQSKETTDKTLNPKTTT